MILVFKGIDRDGKEFRWAIPGHSDAECVTHLHFLLAEAAGITQWEESYMSREEAEQTTAIEQRGGK